MSSTLGASCSSHWSATRVGVIPSRAAVWMTTGLVSTGLSGPHGQPSGQNGTNAIPRLRHSPRRGAARRSARWNRFCTQTMSAPAVQPVRGGAVPRWHSLAVLLGSCRVPGSSLANEWPTNDQCHDRHAWRSWHLAGNSLSGWPDLNRRPLRPELSALVGEWAASRHLRWSQRLSGCRSPRLPAPDGVSPLSHFAPRVGHDPPGEVAARLPEDGQASSRDVTSPRARTCYIRLVMDGFTRDSADRIERHIGSLWVAAWARGLVAGERWCPGVPCARRAMQGQGHDPSFRRRFRRCQVRAVGGRSGGPGSGPWGRRAGRSWCRRQA